MPSEVVVLDDQFGELRMSFFHPTEIEPFSQDVVQLVGPSSQETSHLGELPRVTIGRLLDADLVESFLATQKDHHFQRGLTLGTEDDQPVLIPVEVSRELFDGLRVGDLHERFSLVSETSL